MPSRRRSRAQSLIETVVGCIFLIPIVLFIFDVFAIIMANQTHDTMLKDAARAGGSGATDADAITNVNRVVNAFTTKEAAGGNSLVQSVSVQGIYIDRDGTQHPIPAVGGGTPPGAATPGPNGTISLRSQMVIRLPVPVPGFATTYNFQASAIEPVVGQPP